jgi:hypothetical protein
MRQRPPFFVIAAVTTTGITGNTLINPAGFGGKIVRCEMDPDHAHPPAARHGDADLSEKRHHRHGRSVIEHGANHRPGQHMHRSYHICIVLASLRKCELKLYLLIYQTKTSPFIRECFCF